MPTRRFETVRLSGCAIVFAASLVIENAHAQPGYVPPPTPLPPRFQSVQSLYGASTELQAHHADNTKHRSRICGYAVDQ